MCLLVGCGSSSPSSVLDAADAMKDATPRPDAAPDAAPATCHLAQVSGSVSAVAFDPPDTIYYDVENAGRGTIYKQVGDAAPDPAWLATVQVQGMVRVGRSLYYYGLDNPSQGVLTPSIHVVDLDATTPIAKRIALPGPHGPYSGYALAVAQDGTIFFPVNVTNADYAIYALAPGQSSWTMVTTSPLSEPSGLVVDPSGTLYAYIGFSNQLWRIDRGADGAETKREQIFALPAGLPESGQIDYGLIRDARGRFLTTSEGGSAVLRITLDPAGLDGADQLFGDGILAAPAIGAGCWGDDVYVGKLDGALALDGSAFHAL